MRDEFKFRHRQAAAVTRVCAAVGVVWLACAARAQDSDDWTQHLRIGVPVVLGIRAHFNTTGPFTLSGQPGPAGVSGVNHIYDDGYVKVDATGNAGGYTGYWGYQNASQYNAAAQTLTMHSANSYSTGNGSADENGPNVGIEASYGTDLWRLNREMRIGWEIGAALTPMRIVDNEPLAATVSQSAFTFNTGSIVVPTAPYNGGPGGPGVAEPTIHDVATAQPGMTVPGTVTGERKLDLMLYTFRLGPTFTWDFMPRAGLLVSAGPAMGLVSGAYRFDETITTMSGGSIHNSGSIGTLRTVFGGYANAGLLVRVGEGWDLYLGAQYMPLGTVNMNGPGREASLDLRQTEEFTLGMGWSF
jgi:hypothetical protein